MNVKKLFDLSGKTALITGGSTGLGRVGAELFAAEGAQVAAVVIDDEPSLDQRRENGLGEGDSLYGLYEGVSRITYGADFPLVPNKITLFRLPLEEDFADPRDLAREVQRTVVHELAHHAGISDAELRRGGF